MTAESVALFVVGLIQPFLQEAIIRNRVSDRAAALLTLAVSAAIALLAVWLTGGLATGKVPEWSVSDPSPLLAFLVQKITPVYALSQVIWGTFKPVIHTIAGTADPIGGTPAPQH